eukprot:scaffold67345_cov39-Phaeocystis_antarctica.AAC.1
MPSEAHRAATGVKEEGGVTAPPPPPPPPTPPPPPPQLLNTMQPLQQGGAPPMRDLARLNDPNPIVTNFATARPPGTLGKRLAVHSNACRIRGHGNLADGSDDMGLQWGLVVTQYDVHFITGLPCCPTT